MNIYSTAYPTIEEAMSHLQALTGIMILGDMRRKYKELISENGLSRQYVEDLATELVREMSRLTSGEPKQPAVTHEQPDRPCADCLLPRGENPGTA